MTTRKRMKRYNLRRVTAYLLDAEYDWVVAGAAALGESVSAYLSAVVIDAMAQSATEALLDRAFDAQPDSYGS